MIFVMSLYIKLTHNVGPNSDIPETVFILGASVMKVLLEDLSCGLPLKNWETHSIIVGFKSDQNFLKISGKSIRSW